MKKTIYALMTVLLLFSLATQAQVGIGLPASAVNASALLEVSTTNKGFLPPRMTEAQRNNIPNPAAGLILWCSNCGTSGEIQVYNGSTWTNFVGGAAEAAAPLVIGQSYQGGKIAYIDGTGLHGLIVANMDQGTSVAWYNGSHTDTYATGTAIGTGMANTNAIIASQGNTGVYAAKICRDYRGGEYADWYLPSKDELNQLYINSAAVGGFADNYYWSSSESGISGAQIQNLTSGYQFSGGNKSTAYNVRAVRAF
jgi:hypothetical protein